MCAKVISDRYKVSETRDSGKGLPSILRWLSTGLQEWRAKDEFFEGPVKSRRLRVELQYITSHRYLELLE
jgi:hypothetical protein